MTNAERARVYLRRFASEGAHGWIDREAPALEKLLEEMADEGAAQLSVLLRPKLERVAALESVVRDAVDGWDSDVDMTAILERGRALLEPTAPQRTGEDDKR